MDKKKNRNASIKNTFGSDLNMKKLKFFFYLKFIKSKFFIIEILNSELKNWNCVC